MTQNPGQQLPSPDRGAESTTPGAPGQQPAQPWIKLWPKDWAGDLRLRTVSLQARGTFWSLFLLMHQGGGSLRIGGQSPTDAQLAALLCCDVSELRRSLDELLSSGLIRRAADLSLESPELLRQMQLSATRASASLSRDRNENASTVARNEILLKQNRAAKRGSGSGSGSRHGSGSTPAKELISYFQEKYLDAYREPFPVKWGRDTKAINEMLSFASGEMAAVKRKIDLAFDNHWYRERGLSLVKISSAWSSLHDPKAINGTKHHPDFQAARTWWDHAWHATRKLDPVVTSDDERALDAILERLGGFQQTKVRIAHMLESEDPVVRQWASLPFLSKHIDQFALPSTRKE